MVRNLFDEGKRRNVKDAIERGDPAAFRKRENALGKDDEPAYGSLIASGSAVAYCVTARGGRCFHFDLKESESVEIEGIRFTYAGCWDKGAETDHLNFDVECGRMHGQVRIPFFEDSSFTISDIGKRIAISPASRGSNPARVSGTISVEDI
jgi:hypothetical protein